MVRCNRNDGHFFHARTVTPEDAVCRRCAILDVRHENFLSCVIRVRAGRENVRPKPRMTRIVREEREAFVNLFEESAFPTDIPCIKSQPWGIRHGSNLSILSRSFRRPTQGEASAHWSN